MRDFLTKDISWKVLSLGLAIGIWITIRSVSPGSNPQVGGDPFGSWETYTFTNLPVLALATAGDVRAYKVIPETVNVTIRARPEVLARLSRTEIPVYVDLTGIEAAQSLRRRVQASPPPAVYVDSVTPKEVRIVAPPKVTPTEP